MKYKQKIYWAFNRLLDDHLFIPYTVYEELDGCFKKVEDVYPTVALGPS